MSLGDIERIINQEIEAIRNIPQSVNIINAVDLIYSSVHENGGKLVITGVGKAGEIGTNIATTFCSTGTPSVFLHPLEAVHGNLGLLQKNDVLLAISNSGRTREILELIPIAKKLISGLPVISMTGYDDSPISKKSDILLSTGRPREICPLGLTPTTSTTVMTVLGDIMVYLLMRKIDFTKEEYGKRHHGGYLGSIAKGDAY